jgi:hypothetical protein
MASCGRHSTGRRPPERPRLRAVSRGLQRPRLRQGEYAGTLTLIDTRRNGRAIARYVVPPAPHVIHAAPKVRLRVRRKDEQLIDLFVQGGEAHATRSMLLSPFGEAHERVKRCKHRDNQATEPDRNLGVPALRRQERGERLCPYHAREHDRRHSEIEVEARTPGGGGVVSPQEGLEASLLTDEAALLVIGDPVHPTSPCKSCVRIIPTSL